jgi:hypothetical protein
MTNNRSVEESIIMKYATVTNLDYATEIRLCHSCVILSHGLPGTTEN